MENKDLPQELIELDIKNKVLSKKIKKLDNLISESETQGTFNVLQNIILIALPIFAAIIDVIAGGVALGKLSENVPLEGVLPIIKIVIISLTIVTVELALGLLLFYLKNNPETHIPSFQIFKYLSYAFILTVPFLASSEVVSLVKNQNNPYLAAFSLASEIIKYIGFIILSSTTHFYLLFNAKRITSSLSEMRKYLYYLFLVRKRNNKQEKAFNLSVAIISLISNLTLKDGKNINSMHLSNYTKEQYQSFYT